jgi:hypothetical protein
MHDDGFHGLAFINGLIPITQRTFRDENMLGRGLVIMVAANQTGAFGFDDGGVVIFFI